jgi:MFS family permease
MSIIKTYIASIIGEVLEWYDFSLYGLLSPLFASLFFPQGDTFLSILLVYAIFALGFISRPLGGLLLGHLADKKGRKAAFSLSLLLMAGATFLIACLPTYKTAGFFAPLMLILLRLVQGFSCGGEFSLSMIFLSEHARKKNYYFSGSLTWMGTMIGALMASCLIMFLSAWKDFFLVWGWRIPFFLGGIIAIIGLYLRLHIRETPVYQALKIQKRIETNIWPAIKKQKWVLCKIAMLNAPLAILSYVGIAFFPTFFSQFLGFSFQKAFLINTILVFMLILLIPLFGYIADRCSGIKIYLLSLILLILLSFPIYYLFSHGNSWLSYMAAILLFAFTAAMIKSVTPGLSVALTSLENRALIMSFAYNISYCFLGGTAPLFMTYLIGKTAFLEWPALYIMFFAFLSFILFAFRFFYHGKNSKMGYF